MRGQQSAAGSASDYSFAAALNSVVPQRSVALQATRVAQLAQELQQRQQVRARACVSKMLWHGPWHLHAKPGCLRGVWFIG